MLVDSFRIGSATFIYYEGTNLAIITGA